MPRMLRDVSNGENTSSHVFCRPYTLFIVPTNGHFREKNWFYHLGAKWLLRCVFRDGDRAHLALAQERVEIRDVAREHAGQPLAIAREIVSELRVDFELRISRTKVGVRDDVRQMRELL